MLGDHYYYFYNYYYSVKSSPTFHYVSRQVKFTLTVFENDTHNIAIHIFTADITKPLSGHSSSAYVMIPQPKTNVDWNRYYSAIIGSQKPFFKIKILTKQVRRCRSKLGQTVGG